jgi:hypothetical protein
MLDNSIIHDTVKWVDKRRYVWLDFDKLNVSFMYFSIEREEKLKNIS